MKKTLILLIAIILLGFTYLFYITDNMEDDYSDIQNNAPKDEEEPKEFESEKYQFSLSYPSDWNLHEGYDDRTPKINFYKSEISKEDYSLPFYVNETHVSVYPEGIPTENLMGQTIGVTETDISFGYDLSDDSRVYVLENGQPFAAYLKPLNSPSDWKEYGFIWLRAKVDNLNTKCERDGQIVSKENCDPLTMGDQIIWNGSVEQNSWTESVSIVKSFNFTENVSIENSERNIKINSPKEGQVISSPVSISGKAPGTWFFEGIAPVVLVDWDGRIIAESNVQVDGNWMTDSPVPFSGTLKFEEPEDIGDYSDIGTLILQKSNPSGLPENDDAYELNVFFR